MRFGMSLLWDAELANRSESIAKTITWLNSDYEHQRGRKGKEGHFGRLWNGSTWGFFLNSIGAMTHIASLLLRSPDCH